MCVVNSPWACRCFGVTGSNLKWFDGPASVMSQLRTDFDLRWFDALDSVLSLSGSQVTDRNIKCFASLF